MSAGLEARPPSAEPRPGSASSHRLSAIAARPCRQKLIGFVERSGWADRFLAEAYPLPIFT